MRVAYAIRKEASHTHDAIAVAGEGDVLRLTEGSTESLGRAPVVEIVRRQIGLHLCPIDAFDRAVDTNSHNSRIARSRPGQCSRVSPGARRPLGVPRTVSICEPA